MQPFIEASALTVAGLPANDDRGYATRFHTSSSRQLPRGFNTSMLPERTSLSVGRQHIDHSAPMPLCKNVEQCYEMRNRFRDRSNGLDFTGTSYGCMQAWWLLFARSRLRLFYRTTVSSRSSQVTALKGFQKTWDNAFYNFKSPSTWSVVRPWTELLPSP